MMIQSSMKYLADRDLTMNGDEVCANKDLFHWSMPVYAEEAPMERLRDPNLDKWKREKILF